MHSIFVFFEMIIFSLLQLFIAHFLCLKFNITYLNVQYSSVYKYMGSLQKIYIINFKYYFNKKMSYTTYIKPDRQLDLPLDSVQSILWDPYDRNCKCFFTCGWDGYVRYYQIEGTSTKRLQKKWDFYFHHPVITMDVTSTKLVIVGLATGQIGLVDMQNTNNVLCLGSHLSPVCKVIWIERFQVLVTFGFDNLIKVFTLKPSQNNNFQTSQYKLPAKTTTVSFSYPYFLVGAQDGKIALLNIQKINDLNFGNQYQNIFDQSHGIVKFTCSALFVPKGRIFLGTADGRMISTTFTEGSTGVRILKPVVNRYQKKNSYRKQLVGQMNCFDYGLKENKYEFLIFCGTEEMAVFSPEKSQKIKSLGSSTSSIGSVTAVAISPDCEYYAFAIGNDWSKGLQQFSSYTSIKINVAKISTSDVSSMTSSYMR